MLMCRQTAQGKDMSNLWIIVCVLCWFSQAESQTVHIEEPNTDWFTAYQTCTMQQGRLPGVNIYDHRLRLKDLSYTKNITSPFWIDTTYDIMDCNHFEPNSDLCSDTLCQTITISSEKINVEWRPCSECNNFSCIHSNSQIYQEADWKNECKDWSGAFQECKGKQSSLATRENVPFLERVKTSAKTFWLDDMPQINLAPDIRMEYRTCLYSFNGIIHDGNCSDASMTTVCILVKTTGMTHTTSTMVPYQTMYTKGMTHTRSTVFPSQTVYTAGMTHTTSTMFPSQTVYTAGMTHTTSTMFPSQTVYTAGIWPILGSALGGFVVIIIVVLMIIIVLRRRRMKNDPEKAFNFNANNTPATKNMSQTKPAYDTVLGESFALESTIATSTVVSTAEEEEPVIYALPQKVKTNCRNPIDVPFSIKQLTDEKENTGLYNVVQKGKKTRGIPNTFVNDDVLGKDYYDISFMETGKGEAVENVYNKANFNHSRCDEDQTVNMYDKANFRHEILENNTGNDYDEANFRQEILENNTDNNYDEANFRNEAIVRDSENENENEMFHRPDSLNYD